MASRWRGLEAAMILSLENPAEGAKHEPNVPERRRLAALMVCKCDENNTKHASFVRKYGAGEWTRTTDLLITN